MIEFAVVFVAGMFVGAGIGVIMFALVCMSGQQDDIQERHR
jgi:hypothetical protein